MEKILCELLHNYRQIFEVKDLRSTYIANCVFNSFLSYTAIMLNILTIHAIRKTLSLPKTSKTLLLSLAVSDVGVGLLSQPFYTALLVGLLQQHSPSCKAYTVFTVITYVFCMASFFGVVALSLDRFLAEINMAAKCIFFFDDFMGCGQCLLSCGASPRSCFTRSHSNG